MKCETFIASSLDELRLELNKWLSEPETPIDTYGIGGERRVVRHTNLCFDSRYSTYSLLVFYELAQSGYIRIMPPKMATE